MHKRHTQMTWLHHWLSLTRCHTIGSQSAKKRRCPLSRSGGTAGGVVVLLVADHAPKGAHSITECHVLGPATNVVTCQALVRVTSHNSQSHAICRKVTRSQESRLLRFQDLTCMHVSTCDVLIHLGVLIHHMVCTHDQLSDCKATGVEYEFRQRCSLALFGFKVF